VRHALPCHALLTLVHALIISKVDYCNSVLVGMSMQLRDQLESVLNATAWSFRPRCPTTSPHCLRTFIGCMFWNLSSSGCVLAYRCLHSMAPLYLADNLQLTSAVGTRRNLQSANLLTLMVMSTRCSMLGDRTFPVAAARAWNSLPSSVRDVPSLLSFWSCLKTWLFELTLA